MIELRGRSCCCLLEVKLRRHDLDKALFDLRNSKRRVDRHTDGHEQDDQNEDHSDLMPLHQLQDLLERGHKLINCLDQVFFPLRQVIIGFLASEVWGRGSELLPDRLGGLR